MAGIRIRGAALGLCALSLSLPAIGVPTNARFERLDPGSEFVDEHCVGACACPSYTEHGPMTGRWVLFPQPPDPLYDIWDVAVRDWVAITPQRTVHLTGAGRYWLGGEFAITQRLALDLSIDGGPPIRFDSGFVPATIAAPPVIHLTSSTDIVVCDRFSVQVIGVLTCESDLNADAHVGFADLNEVLSNYGAHGAPGFVAGDANADGDVDFNDLNDVLSSFGNSCFFP